MRLKVRVIPRARKHEFAGIRQDAYVIRLAAPPVEGAANAALIEFLAATFDIPKRQIQLVSGERSRDKVVEVAGLTPERLRVWGQI